MGGRKDRTTYPDGPGHGGCTGDESPPGRRHPSGGVCPWSPPTHVSSSPTGFIKVVTGFVVRVKPMNFSPQWSWHPATPLGSKDVSRSAICGDHSNIRATWSSMKTLTVAVRIQTKTGCRWRERSSICNRSPPRSASTHLHPFGDFTSLRLQTTRSATSTPLSRSIGIRLIGAFTLHLAPWPMGGRMLEPQSRFATNRLFHSLWSRSYTGFPPRRRPPIPGRAANNGLHWTRR